MKEDIISVVISSVVTWALSHVYYRKKKKSDLQALLIERIEDLSAKYVMLNEQYTELVVELNAVKIENQNLKNQLISLRVERN